MVFVDDGNRSSNRKWRKIRIEYEAERIWDGMVRSYNIDPSAIDNIEQLYDTIDKTIDEDDKLSNLKGANSTGRGIAEIKEEAASWWEEERSSRGLSTGEGEQTTIEETGKGVEVPEEPEIPEGTEIPEVEGAEAPEVDVPETEVPEVEAPEVEAPEVEAPTIPEAPRELLPSRDIQGLEVSEVQPEEVVTGKTGRPKIRTGVRVKPTSIEVFEIPEPVGLKEVSTVSAPTEKVYEIPVGVDINDVIRAGIEKTMSDIENRTKIASPTITQRVADVGYRISETISNIGNRLSGFFKKLR